MDRVGDGKVKAMLDTSAESISRDCHKSLKCFLEHLIDEAMNRRETARKALEDDDSEPKKD